MLSGGLDSEVMVRAFMEAGVPFEAHTFSLGQASAREVQYALEAAARLGIQTSVYELDISWLDSEEAVRFFKLSRSFFVEMLPHMKLMQVLHDRGYHTVLGNGEVLLERNAQWEYVEYEYDLAWYRFAYETGVSASCGFFQQTPEIQAAALLHPRHVQLVRGANALANKVLKTSRPVKYKMYLDEYPDLVRREKLDGFEYLRSYGIARSPALRKELGLSYGGKVLIPYDELVRQLNVPGT